MKKFRLLSAFALGTAMLFSSCSKEMNATNPDETLGGGDVQVTMNVAAKDIKPVETYASNAQNMLAAGYELRYTTEIFLREGEGNASSPYTYDKLVKRIVEYTNQITPCRTTFRIPAGNYAFITWTDYVKRNETGEVTEDYYDQSNLLNIKKKYGLELTSDDMQDFEVRDAFKGVLLKEITNKAMDQNITYTIYHAVAKINVVAQDIYHLYSDYNGQENYTPDNSKLANKIQSIKLSYKVKSGDVGSINLWSKYNPNTYYTNVNGDNEVEYVSTFTGEFDYTQAANTYLTDYVIVDGINDTQKTINNIKIDVLFQGGNLNTLVSPVDNVPVRTRYVTNLVGDILTKRVLSSVILSETWQTGENTVDMNTTTTAPITEGVAFASTTPIAYNNVTPFVVAVVNAVNAEAALTKITPTAGSMDIIDEFTAEEITTYAATDNKAFRIKAKMKVNYGSYYRQASFTVKYSDNNGTYVQNIYQAPAANYRHPITATMYVSDVDGKSGLLTTTNNRTSITPAQLYAEVAQEYTVTDLYGEKVGSGYYTYVDVVAQTKRNPRSLKLAIMSGQSYMGAMDVGYKDANGVWKSDNYGKVVASSVSQTPIEDQTATLSTWSENGATAAQYMKWTIRVQTNFNSVSTKAILANLAFQDYEWLTINKAQSTIIVNQASGAITAGNFSTILADQATAPYGNIGYMADPSKPANLGNPWKFAIKFNPRVMELLSKTNTSIANKEYFEEGAYLPKDAKTLEIVVKTNRPITIDCISTNQPTFTSNFAVDTLVAPNAITKIGEYKFTYNLAAMTTTGTRGANIYIKPYASILGGGEKVFDENPATALIIDAPYQQGFNHTASTYRKDNVTYYGFISSNNREYKSTGNYFSTTTPAEAKAYTNQIWYIRSNRFKTTNEVKNALTVSENNMLEVTAVSKVTNVGTFANGAYFGANFTGDTFWKVTFKINANETSTTRNAYIFCNIPATGTSPKQDLNVRIYQTGVTVE